jgi:PTS system mannose-specific IIB component
MPIILNRVDDRLIHGQVVTNWIRSNDIQVIVIVDEALAKDELQQSILKLATPPGVKLYTMAPESFAKKYKAGILDQYRVMLVFANVLAPLALVQAGIDLKVVNIGGMRFKEGRRQIAKAISVSPQEEQAIREMALQGVEIEHRMVITDPKVNVIDLL